MRLQLSFLKSPKWGIVDVVQFGLNWDTRLHMAVLQVIEEWKAFRSNFTESRPLDIPSANQCEPEAKQTWIVSLKERTIIRAILSPTHTVQFQAGKSNNRQYYGFLKCIITLIIILQTTRELSSTVIDELRLN